MLGSRLYGEAWQLIWVLAALLGLTAEAEARAGIVRPRKFERAESFVMRAGARLSVC